MKRYHLGARLLPAGNQSRGGETELDTLQNLVSSARYGRSTISDVTKVLPAASPFRRDGGKSHRVGESPCGGIIPVRASRHGARGSVRAR